MSNQLVQLVPHFSLALDFQSDQLAAAGATDINAFDLQGAHGLGKIRGSSPRREPLARGSMVAVDANFIAHGKIPLSHFHDDHLNLREKMGHFADKLPRRQSGDVAPPCPC